jgi:hypothetical protein
MSSFVHLRASGLGDFGVDGIETFVDTHQCNRFCEKLEFDAVFPLELPADIPGPDPTEDGSGSDGGSGFGNVEGEDDD